MIPFFTIYEDFEEIKRISSKQDKTLCSIFTLFASLMTYLVNNTYQSLNSKYLLGLSILVFIIYFAVWWYQGKPESQVKNNLSV